MDHINDESPVVGQDTYFIPADSTEYVRLGKQDRAVTASMDLKPKGKHKKILDVCCGTGGWIREVVRLHPEVEEIIGFDNNKKIIDISRNHAATRNNKKVKYVLMNLVDMPWEFPDAYFDFVNIRFITGVVSRDKATWRATFAEALRVLKPGGSFRLTESEMSLVPDAEFTNRMLFALMQVMWKMEKSFANWQLAVTPVLSKLLDESGLVDIEKQPIMLDYSYGTLLHGPVVEDLLYVMQTSRAGLIRFGDISEGEFDALLEEVRGEVYNPAFLANWPITSWVARKAQV